MKIYIKSPSHPTIEIKTTGTSTIKSLKHQIEQTTSIPISEQKLYKDLSTELLNEHKLSSYLIQNLSCLTLKLSLPPRSSSFTSPVTATISNLRRYSIDVCSKNDPFEVLFQKCKESDVNLVRSKLIENKELVKIYSSEGWALLHYAGFIGNTEMISLMLEFDADVNQLTQDRRWTVLHLVCIQGHVNALNCILGHKDVLVDMEAEENSTALHCACLNGNAMVVELLLKAKANCTIENQYGQLPIDLALSREVKEVIGKYMGKSEDFPEFFEGPICVYRIIADLKGWGVLRPAEGVFFVYKTQKAFLQKKPPQRSFDVREMKEIRRCRSPFLQRRGCYFFHMVSSASGEKHKFYSESEEIANFWVKNLFTSLLYRQSHSKKSEAEEAALLEFPSTPGIDFFSFDILKQIGAGSFSVVHLVRKKDTNEQYAMKSMAKQFLISKNYLKNAITESRVLSIVNCPYIIRLHFCFKTPRSLYMVLEHCPNGTLSSLLQQTVTLPEELSKIYICEIIIAIEYLHNMNIIYRDLKPENILISHNWHLKLADFGLVKENVVENTLCKSFCGTPAYLSPEMLNRAGVNKKADVYAIGCILFEMFAGVSPFYSDSMAVLLKRIEKGTLKFPQNINPEVEDLIRLMLQRRPEIRPGLTEVKAHKFFEGVNWESAAGGTVMSISSGLVKYLQDSTSINS